ncbi:uncharacterized protein C8R40DRAFT_1079618 [Lentinula edodes]|uniref:uncharacterized protein n=1 Tax=Lentinula edodes TaxID=5353 RepID=UPI001E8DA67D|nr:uncharacterized protein C8R40DRAFT_1079618 [Lentinula edodes]KAH7880285.1 hypothetical protein C8R40DRAFT_1079618 [Lentinula edodes]
MFTHHILTMHNAQIISLLHHQYNSASMHCLTTNLPSVFDIPLPQHIAFLDCCAGFLQHPSIQLFYR